MSDGNGWRWIYEGYDPDRVGLREALCTLGNGRFATRGALPEMDADGRHYPGTYFAGLYNRLGSPVGDRTVENEDLVNLPNWLLLTFRIDDGPWFSIDDVDILSHRLELDLRRGVLTRTARFTDPAGNTTSLTQRRIVSMADPYLAALETTITPESWAGTLTVRSGIDADVENTGVARYRQLASRHLRTEDASEWGDEVVGVVTETVQSRVRVAVAARTTGPASAVRHLHAGDGVVAHDLTMEVVAGAPVTVEKVIALHTSRDHAISEPALDARLRVERAPDFDELAASHVLAWEQLWDRFDTRIEGDERAQLVLRVHLFHLLATVSPNTIGLDVGVPARGLHGEAYRGHIFWDEVFILPVIAYRNPVLAASLLEYRYGRLDAARWAAADAGHRGAMFPWQSGSDGREETQTLHLNPRSGRWLSDRSHRQRHINHAIAYNVWHHFQVSGDLGFLRFRGGPLLCGIARYLADLATYDRALDRYRIRGVMGPDEFHDGYPDAAEGGLDDNAYTNVMTAWVLQRALDCLDLLPPHQSSELRAELGIDEKELERWLDVSRRLRVPFHDDGIISQFDGYEALQELDWERYRERYGDIQRLDRILEAEGDTPNRYKVSKQADVLMLRFLLSTEELEAVFSRLGYDLPDLRRNTDYYLQRTSHGSTLSRVVHSWVLARLDRETSWQLLSEALESDVADIQGGTTSEGVHLGAMAGTVDLCQRAYTGLEVRDGMLCLDPALPSELTCLAFPIHLRGHRIELEVRADELVVRSRPGSAPPLPLRVREQRTEIETGAELTFRLS